MATAISKKRKVCLEAKRSWHDQTREDRVSS